MMAISKAKMTGILIKNRVTDWYCLIYMNSDHETN